LCPLACDGAPDHGQPTRVDKSVSVDLARRGCEDVSGGWHPGSKCNSSDSIFTTKHRYLRARGRRNERNRFLSFAPGGLLALPNINLAGDCRYRSCCNPVQRSTIEGKPFEEKPKHRLPDRVGPARCTPGGRKRFRGGFGRLRNLLRSFGQKAAPIARANSQRMWRNAIPPDNGVRRLR